MAIRAEVITIGDELLMGQTIDTNSAWIGAELHKLGVAVYQITSITDEREHIVSAIKAAESRCDLILITGGLGPTKDDLTKQTLVDYFETKLVLHPEMYAKIEAFCAAHNLPMIESNRQQAFLPASCTVIINDIGTAAGMWFQKKEKVIVSMPGVPFEMKAMMIKTILPMIKSHFETTELVYKMIYTAGIGESFLVEKILDWENSLAEDNLKIAYLPERGKVKIRLSGEGPDRSRIETVLERKVLELNALIREYVVDETEYHLSAHVGKLLMERKETVATAESCTGGSIASLFTQVAGSSQYFIGSVVAYHEKVKEKILEVGKQEIDKFGVVSQEVAEQMALGVAKALNTDWGVATTGIAGPSGGDKLNPVGTVWIGIAYRGGVFSRRYVYTGNRGEVIEKAAKKAIVMLKDRILSKEV